MESKGLRCQKAWIYQIQKLWKVNKVTVHNLCGFLNLCGRLECVDDRPSKPFRLYLDEDACYSFINSMIEESKYCKEVIKR